jgi:hypothetical protein
MSTHWINSFLFIIVCAGGVSCATGPVVPIEELRAGFPVFSQFACKHGEGTAGIRVWQQDQFIGRYEVDWEANAPGWRLSVSESLGLELLRATYIPQEKYFSTEGRIAHMVPLAIDGDAGLLADGHYAGIAAPEVPCLLQGALPHRWLRSLRVTQKSKDSTTFESRDARRRIIITAKSGESENYCVNLRMSKFLGFFSYGPDYCVSKLDGKRIVNFRWDQTRLELRVLEFEDRA